MLTVDLTPMQQLEDLPTCGIAVNYSYAVILHVAPRSSRRIAVTHANLQLNSSRFTPFTLEARRIFGVNLAALDVKASWWSASRELVQRECEFRGMI